LTVVRISNGVVERRLEMMTTTVDKFRTLDEIVPGDRVRLDASAGYARRLAVTPATSRGGPPYTPG
jgi:hypothetical protein